MEKKQCKVCDSLFQPRPQVPHQSYCSTPACQRERRRQWQRHKLKTDSDYLENQARAQHAWSERNPDYCRNYRASHPEYVKRNRALQHARNAKAVYIAKMDESTPVMPLPSGIYSLRLVSGCGIARMDVWTVEITAYACKYISPVKIAKR